MGSKFLNWLFPSRRRSRARVPKSDYELRPLSSQQPAGRGFGLFRVENDEQIEWPSLPPGFLSFKVDAVEEENINDSAFLPGRHLRLAPAGETVTVLDDHQKIAAGRVPAQARAEVSARLSSQARFDCIAIWEEREAGRRTGLRVLLVDRGTSVHLPE